MFKKLIFNNAKRKISKFEPKVSVNLHNEMPSPSIREVTELAKTAALINGYEKELRDKPDSFFKEKTNEYRKFIADKVSGLSEDVYENTLKKTLNDIMPYYYACVREAARRTLKMRHFDVQMIGGMILHNNMIAEMTTGEGKTLVATLPVSLNALVGRGVHVVTVNDYLAKRDMEWMEPVYNFLGFTCGVIQQDMPKELRRRAYACDITYGTNNEFGFDYLRDHMVTSPKEKVQRDYFYAIVDEVDSILIDEARTPLIISGPSEVSIDKYYKADKVVRQLQVKTVIQTINRKDGTVRVKNIDGTESVIMPDEFEQKYDAIIEIKTNNSYLTSKGEEKCTKLLNVSSLEESPDPVSNVWLHYITQSLRAHSNELFRKDKEYIVKDGKVLIVDDFTGRLMPGRRWSDGLHQAVEAKENLRIQEESQTLATVTLQNYFRMYFKLAGMTGTAYTEANEFEHIYKLDVVVVPTNRPLNRKSAADRIYKTKNGKFEAVIQEIVEYNKRKQPVLVGTASIEDSEILSFMLNKRGVRHNVLNAKYHEREAHIVAQAGRLNQVTIATNMAGRGTDIVLGGNLDFFVKDMLGAMQLDEDTDEYKDNYQKLIDKHKNEFESEHNKVVELGGLHVIGTQRHESRRIDNQLRGRSGRQGDPGSSRFYVSLEDDLMKLFGSDKIYAIMDKFGFPEDQPIEHALINHSLSTAQKRVEGHNFEIRKQLLQYDDIMNKQREFVYNQRDDLLMNEGTRDDILDMAYELVDDNIAEFFGDEKNIIGLSYWAKSKFDLDIDITAMQEYKLDKAAQVIRDSLKQKYVAKEEEYGAHELRMMEQWVSLRAVDSKWKEHLLIMDSLKEAIGLRGYAHVDPLVEYQKESFYLFQNMIDSAREMIVESAFKTKILIDRPKRGVFENTPHEIKHDEFSSLKAQGKKNGKRIITVHDKKVGRNDPCPCGSGKKYKKCCGA
ncbi:MAG: preprotein translocase subunit SecA [Candidatus Omnitrophica bacterium]|nr:preprotein translocase subunit SecA [Candidatus Omnitrophota bacterium]MDD5081522.1 preprotein translocase subunit SecA [Candidatus Omnitrophota bacterium]